MKSGYTLSIRACALLLGFAPCISRSFFVANQGTVDLFFQSVDPTYVVNLYENGNHVGPAYAAALDMATSNFSSSTLQAPSTSLYVFCVELGQDAPGGNGTPGTSELYQIFTSNNASLVDNTNLAGIPNPQANVGPVEASAGITATGGIGSYRLGQLELLYGYAFGTKGALSAGYNPASLSAQEQVAFQLAVWKLAYEGTPAAPATLFSTSGGVSAPGLSVTGADSVIANANSLLSGVSADVGIAPMALDALNNGTYQDFLAPASSFTQIPEPPTYATMLGVLTLSFVLLRRWRATSA